MTPVTRPGTSLSTFTPATSSQSPHHRLTLQVGKPRHGAADVKGLVARLVGWGGAQTPSQAGRGSSCPAAGNAAPPSPVRWPQARRLLRGGGRSPGEQEPCQSPHCSWSQPLQRSRPLFSKHSSSAVLFLPQIQPLRVTEEGRGASAGIPSPHPPGSPGAAHFLFTLSPHPLPGACTRGLALPWPCPLQVPALD